MIVDCPVWHFTRDGMRAGESTLGRTSFVEVREVERLLEEAHRRGREAGLEEARSQLREGLFT